MKALPLPLPAWLKKAGMLAHWALGLTLAVWLLAGGVWGALHWLIVPRIGDFRPLLEAQASRALALPVKIGAIEATTNGLIPSVTLSRVTLQDKNNRDALTLGRVVIALSPRSLLKMGVEQLYVDQPQLDVRRRMDGHIVVAGIDLSEGDTSGSSVAADWLFSQAELVVKNGQINWTDELRGQPVLALQQVDLLVRNAFRTHQLRLEAALPTELGDRITTHALFHQPLLATRDGRWQDWSGNAFAAFARVDLAALGRYVDWGAVDPRGQGAARAWINVERGELGRVTADLALADASASLDGQHVPLKFSQLSGRISGRVQGQNFEFQSEGLQFKTINGLVWPGGNISIRRENAASALPGSSPASRTEVAADNLDLAALAQIADHLPLEGKLRRTIAALAPKGLVEQVRAVWVATPDALKSLEAKGRVVRLALASAGPQIPGLEGASASFDLTHAGGKATIQIDQGSIDLPGVLEEARVPLTLLSTDVKWQMDGDDLAVQLPNLRVANADAQGEFNVKWRTSKDGKDRPQDRFPGVLDLQGHLVRGDGARVYRYLPVTILPRVRQYVREAVKAGVVNDVKFRVKGDLHDFPFAQDKNGEFQITARVSDATFAYVPASLSPAGAAPWPELMQLSGDLIINRQSLQIKDVRSRLAGRGPAPGVPINRAEGTIPNLLDAPTVQVTAETRASLTGMLAAVNGSPLGSMLGNVLSDASATGNADLRLKLSLPIAAVDKVGLQGALTLMDNDIRLAPNTPLLAKTRGVLNFSESGFTIPLAQARWMGGDVTFQGGSLAQGPLSGQASRPPVSAWPAGWRTLPNIVIRAQGSFDAAALKHGSEFGAVSRLAPYATGVSNYTAVLAVRQGEPELTVSSNLAGMTLSLPKPFGKPSDITLPVRFQLTNFHAAGEGPGSKAENQRLDQIHFEFGKVLQADFVRDVSGPVARVLRGAVGVGLAADEFAPLPAEGVAANISLPQLDMDAWSAVLAAASAPQAGIAAAGGADLPMAVQAYTPNTLALRAGELQFSGRKFSNVVLGGSRSGPVWRANMEAAELSGYAEYRPGLDNQASRLYARLARLTLAPLSAKDIETVLDEQPASIPALDIVVDDFELRGRRMGRVEIDAVNRGTGPVAREGSAREWRLNKLNIRTPEATFSASGNWSSLNVRGPGTPGSIARPAADRRRTVMNFKLDVNDSGGLLARFGMRDVIRQGQGKLEGRVSWVGSPLMLDYPTLDGAFTVNVESGQFLKADPGFAKLLGVLSLQSLPRRLTLDFRDVFTEGFAFDFVRGDIQIEQGIASTNNLQMKGVNAAVLMDGHADIAHETQSLHVVVVPEINAGTASLIATVINPAVGLGSFLAQWLLRRPLIDSATQEFQIDGTWIEPKVMRVTPGRQQAVKPAPEAAQ
jgi:uncharacterized protein (TIGR02099 family)